MNSGRPALIRIVMSATPNDEDSALTATRTLSPIERQVSLGERAYLQLKELLMSGGMRVGTKLTVRYVADEFGISTTPARDAITRLIGEGGFVNLGPKTVIVPYLTMADLEEITAMRLSLEGLAAERAVEHIIPSDIAALEQIQERLNAGLDAARYGDVLDANREFHFLLYRRSSMRRLVAVIESLWVRIGPSLNELYPEFAQSRTGVLNHSYALKGLQDRDSAAVRAAIESDIRGGFRRLQSFVSASTPKED
ncbi:GntR family transcriptional regulator [Aliirhizobium terrae]|uniref:GntR family transcriptional regulator n=1 Tax=Terrirhizobium terrae TaxID=2926709 RepID=UPI003369BFB5